MKKKLLTLLFVFCSSFMFAQATTFPVELMKEHVSIDDGSYCLGLLGSGPLDYFAPLSNRWEITNVTNTEGKNYYAFRFKGGQNYLTYINDGMGFNTRKMKEGEKLSRNSVFEVHKSGKYYVLYCVGAKSFMKIESYKRGGKVGLINDAAKASKWKITSVPSDPDKYYENYKSKNPQSISSQYFLITNHDETKCIKLDNAGKKIEWQPIAGNTDDELWQIIPLEGFENRYIIRNKAGKIFLRTAVEGFDYNSFTKGSNAVVFKIFVNGEKVWMESMRRVFFDKPITVKCDDNQFIHLIQRDK